MDEDVDLVLFKSERGGCLRIEYLIDNFDFQEVVSGAQRSHLLPAALERAIAHTIRIRAVEAAAFLRRVEVRLRAVAVLDSPARPVFQDILHFALLEFQLTGRAHARRDVAEKAMGAGRKGRPSPHRSGASS